MTTEKFDKIDMLPLNDIKKLQFQLLKKQLDYVWKKSRFYRKKFSDAGITPDDIKTLKDIRKLPFTTKEELRLQNEDFVCISNRKTIDIGTTTGTTGSPILLPVSKKDWDGFVRIVKRGFSMIGITPDDVVQLTLAFDQLFSVSMPSDYALKEIGATVARMGPGNNKKQIELMIKIKSTIIHASPDYMFSLAETAREMGYDPQKDFFLKKGIFLGQPLFDRNDRPTTVKKKIEEIWGIECFSDYGSMEMLAGLFECKMHNGHHSYADWLYLEVINPETGEVLGDDQEGELVATTLMLEAIPVIRYRQGDITRLQNNRCTCGRTSPRIMSIVGRANHLLKIKGTSIYPQQIEELLMQEPGIKNYTIEAFKDANGCDAVKIMAGLQEKNDKVVESVKMHLKTKIRITPEIEVLSPQEIYAIWFRHGDRKPQKFFDLRPESLA
ncbi:MAG: hypothetical protein JW913_11450 [Chitinispirillaceae bacterium]|nr:hypothetical protein [Chitinispirillaceae bacterium]